MSNSPAKHTRQGWSAKRKLVTLGISFAALVVIVVGAIVATGAITDRNYRMDKQALEQTYQEGMQPVQETFTEYLLENYEGVTAIEWQGVEILWRDSPVHGPSLFGNGVTSYYKVFVDDEHYFTGYFRLDEEMEYDHDLEKYVPNEYFLTPSNMDVGVEMDLRQAVSDLDGDPDGVFSGVRKSEAGSPGAKVTYNLDAFDFDFERKY